MPAEDIESIVEPVLQGLPGTAADDFWRSLSSIGQAASPVLQRAAPSIIQGATTGATVGGPWGALIGAGAGFASSAVGGTARPPAAPPQVPTPPPTPVPGPATQAAPATPVPPPSPQVTPGPLLAAAGLPMGAAAAALLLSLFDDPTIKASLRSQVLAGRGLADIPTPNGTSVPRGAINGLLTQLIANATEALPEVESITDQDYLRGESGEFLIDPASPEQQAALVLTHLQRSRPAPPFDAVRSNGAAHWSVEELLGGQSEEWDEGEMEGEGEGEVMEWAFAEDIGQSVRFY